MHASPTPPRCPPDDPHCAERLCDARAPEATCVVDWSKRPEPWSWIGPQFRRECEEIAAARVGPHPHEALKRRREKLGLTQARVAQIAKTQQSHVSKAERGETGPSIIKHINDALDRYVARRR